MFTRKSEKVAKLPQTICEVDYNINDDQMQVDIVIRVNREATYTIQDLINELKSKVNKDIQKYDIKSITYKSIEEKNFFDDMDLY